MSVLLDWIVPVASTVTATAAIGTFSYARRVARQVDENTDRSRSNRELLVGDPAALDRNLVERVRDLEEEIEA